ncbi:hypothetical protein D3C78_882150 [compost metagenome]
MVRELEIMSAAVNIQRVAEIFPCHRRAFDMPAWTAFTKRTFPLDFPWLCTLPQNKVLLILFAVSYFYPNPELELLDVLMRQLPVIGESGGAEIYVALAFISEALINETLNKCNNLWNMVGYSRIKSRLVNAKRFQIGIKSLNKPLSNLGHSRA